MRQFVWKEKLQGQIDNGLLVFLGVAEEDEQTDLDKIV